jgi:hypothetical protein
MVETALASEGDCITGRPAYMTEPTVERESQRAPQVARHKSDQSASVNSDV